MTKKIITILLVFAGITIMYSCTKLNENILDEASVAGLTPKQQAEGIIAPVYAKLEDIFLQTGYFDLQEISTDSNGELSIEVEPTGRWMISAVKMVRLQNDPKAHWQSYWGSVTWGYY